MGKFFTHCVGPQNYFALNTPSCALQTAAAINAMCWESIDGDGIALTLPTELQ
jgi:hypothetical protein